MTQTLLCVVGCITLILFDTDFEVCAELRYVAQSKISKYSRYCSSGVVNVLYVVICIFDYNTAVVPKNVNVMRLTDVRVKLSDNSAA